MANIILRNVSATARIYNVKCAAVLEQGNVAKLGARDADGVYTVSATANVGDLESVLIASVPLNYEAEKVEGDFSLAIGGIGRAYGFYEGFEFEIEDAQIDGATTKDQFCTLNTDTTFKLLAAATLTGNESVAFRVIEKGTLNGVASSTLLCIKA